MDRPVTAEVKEVLAFGPGAPSDNSLDGYVPPDPDHFGFNAQVFIGRTTTDLVDSFDIVVCSPPWFAEQVADGQWQLFRSGVLHAIPDAVAPGAGIWFMRRWDPAELRAALDAVCRTYSPAPDWGSVASRIGRLIPWEFAEHYDDHVDRQSGKPFPPVNRS